MKKLLFICSGNKLRSPTAELYFKTKGYETRSAGTSKDAKRTVSMEDIKWADSIYFMEDKHYSRVYSAFPRAMQFKQNKVLNIPDNYKLMDESLIKILKEINIVF